MEHLLVMAWPPHSLDLNIIEAETVNRAKDSQHHIFLEKYKEISDD